MPLELFIAFRYLKARRRGVFTLITTIIAVGGITLGVAALIITLAVMSGFHRDIREKILGLQPHIIALKEDGSSFLEYEFIMDRIKQNQAVLNVSPFVYGQIILRSNVGSSGAVLKGVDWQKENKLVGIDKKLVDTVSIKNLGDKEIIIGQELARNLKILKGQEVILMSPGQYALVPRMDKFKVAGLFHSGMYEYDATLSYVSLAAGQKLFGLENAVSGIGVSINDWEKADELSKNLQETIKYPYIFRSWQSMNRNLFAALKLEKIMMFIILTLIIVVAAFNIISNLLLLTVEKAKEIGILSALGLSQAQIGRIFLYEGLMIGFAGIFLGSGLGIGISLLLKKYKFIHLPADVYYLDTLPVRILSGDVVSIIAATLIITILSGIYPSYQASKLNPLEAIRYG